MDEREIMDALAKLRKKLHEVSEAISDRTYDALVKTQREGPLDGGTEDAASTPGTSGLE